MVPSSRVKIVGPAVGGVLKMMALQHWSQAGSISLLADQLVVVEYCLSPLRQVD